MKACHEEENDNGQKDLQDHLHLYRIHLDVLKDQDSGKGMRNPRLREERTL
jgi:hypothetical protein